MGKVAIVTGGTSGIGLETLRALEKAGATVYALSRHPAEGVSHHMQSMRFLAKRETALVMIRSILSAYLIQCNDEPGNPISDCESGSKWHQGVSSLKGICGHKKSASSEEETLESLIFYVICHSPKMSAAKVLLCFCK